MHSQQSKLMLIDLRTGEFTPLQDSDVHILSEIETPWKDAIGLHEARFTSQRREIPLDGPFIILTLPLTITSRSITARWREPVYSIPEGLEKKTLMSQWIEPLPIVLAEWNPAVFIRAADELGAR